MRQGHRRRRPRQAKLFEVPSDQPRWQELPLHVRREVIQELARLLESGRRSESRSGSKELGDE